MQSSFFYKEEGTSDTQLDLNSAVFQNLIQIQCFRRIGTRSWLMQQTLKMQCLR